MKKKLRTKKNVTDNGDVLYNVENIMKREK